MHVDGAVAYGAWSPDGDNMTDSIAKQLVEGQPTDRLSAPRAGAGTARIRAARCCAALTVTTMPPTRSVARMRMPLLDEPLRLVSDFANFSKPWFLISSFLALLGGSKGRFAALAGLAAIGAASLVVNQPMKLAGERHRPDRVGGRVPELRWVRMPFVDVVPLRSFRVRSRIRSCRRRRPTGAPASIAGGSVCRGVIPRVYGRALPG